MTYLLILMAQSGDREQCQHLHWQPVSLNTVMNAAKSARNQHEQNGGVPHSC